MTFSKITQKELVTFSKETQEELKNLKFSKETQEELKNLKRISKVMEKAGASLLQALYGQSTQNMSPEEFREHRRTIRWAEFLVEWGEIPESYPSAVQPQNSRPKK